jgi:hypothetical protein
MNTVASQPSSSLLSLEEKNKAAHYLASTRDNVIHAVTGLSDSQWDFKPAPDRWSVAEIVEHIALVENRVHAIIDAMPSAPAAERDRIDSQVDELILTQVPQRLTKVPAGPQVSPSRQWSPLEALKRFSDNRDQTFELLASAPSLRGHVVPHPVLGPWDGYQWILAAAAHCARHTEQILEVKADAGFPEAHSATPFS